MGTAHLLRTLLPLDSVALGRLVKNANRPHQDYIDPLPPRPKPAECLNVHHTNFSETRKFSKGSSMRLGVAELLYVVSSNSKTTTGTLTARNTTTYDLSNSDNWFKDACKQEASRRWLEEAIDKNQNVYLVIGFRTAQHASLISSAATKKGSRVDGVLPLRSIAPPVPLGAGVLNPIAGGTQSHDSKTDLAFDAPGEQVFAVLYRKVKFSWLSSRKTENMKLEEGNRWKSVWEWRGPNENTDEDEDDVLEAELTDPSDLDDDDVVAVVEEDYRYEDEDDDMEERQAQVHAMPEINSAEHASGAASGVEEATGGAHDACITSEPTMRSGRMQIFQGNSRLLIVWGAILVLLLLLFQLFFQWGR